MNQLFFVSLSTYINQRGKKKEEIKKHHRNKNTIPLFHAI